MIEADLNRNGFYYNCDFLQAARRRQDVYDLQQPELC